MSEISVWVALTQAEWESVLQLLQTLSTGEIFSVANPEGALRLRDRIVKQLPMKARS